MSGAEFVLAIETAAAPADAKHLDALIAACG